MSWKPITTKEVLDEFTSTEKDSIEAIQGATTSLAAILSRVVNAWRGAISAGGNTVDTTASTIPDMIHEDVIAMTRWKWLTAMPRLVAMQTESRKAANERAEDRFDMIAEGELGVEPPANEEPVNAITGAWNSENRLNMRTHPVPRPPDEDSTAEANTANDE